MASDFRLSSDARAFIDEVRQVQSKSGQNLGCKRKSNEIQRLAINATVILCSDSVRLFPPSITPQLLHGLLERFEKMAQRNGYEVPDHLRTDTLGLLSTELWVNHHALKTSPTKLVAVTAYNGAIAVLLPKEFPEFADTPGLFREAMVGNPADPRRFLHNVKEMVASLSADEEFECFRETPYMFRRAAVHNPSDPRAWLRSEPTANWHALRVKARRANSPPSGKERD